MNRPAHPEAPRHLPKRGEEGFGLVEVLVASVVILILMLSVGVVLVNSLGSVAYAGQNQGADHLLDATIEQVRALPFSTLQSGLYENDTTVTADPAISGGLYQGTKLLMSTSQPPAPLFPHQSTVSQSAGSAGSYTIDVYPTTDSALGGSAGAVVVTVVVSWNRAARNGLDDSVTAQTVVYSPSAGCLAPTDHPFAAPCQPFLYANATTGGGGITITPDPAVVGGLAADLTSAELTAPTASVDLQSEQIASVSSSASSPGYILTQGSNQTAYGGDAVNSYVDDDPGTSSPPYSSNSGPSTANSAQTVTAPNGVTLSLAGSADAGSTTAVGATAAGSAQPCNDLRGVLVTTGLACGDASAGTASATPLTATVGIPGGGSTADLTVASLAESVAAFAGRAVTSGASFCTTTSGDGCVHAGTARSAFTLGIGGLPAGLGPLPGWNGYLLNISLGDSTSAESGVNAGSPQAGPGVTVNAYDSKSGTYVPLAPGSLPAALTVSGYIGALPASASLTVQDLTIGAPQQTSSGCSSNCESATVGSPVTADLGYSVSVAGIEVFGATVHVDLGTESSSTTYKAAPVAG